MIGRVFETKRLLGPVNRPAGIGNDLVEKINDGRQD
jgi:hypothetical protein